jgi:hypothetical protein
MDDQVSRVVKLPDARRMEAMLQLLIEIQQDNRTRLTRMETRMCRLMQANGLDHEGNKLKA